MLLPFSPLSVNHNIKNIILPMFVALYFIIVFSGKLGLDPTTTKFAPSDNICHIEAATKTESPTPAPKWLRPKPKSYVPKVKMQVGFTVLPNQLPSIQQFAFIKSSSHYRHSPQVSFVRYLPRDPPTA